jgi:outer membrane protein OmpA-like peptidoglycan-associated protein
MRRLLLLLPLLLLVPSTASAQMIAKSVELDFHASYYNFTDVGGFDEDNSVKLENLQDAPLLGGRFGIHFTEWLGMEVSAAGGETRSHDTLRAATYVNAHVDAVFHLPFPYVVPYFAVGAGVAAYAIRPEYAAGAGPASATRPYRDPHFDPAARAPAANVITYRNEDGDFLFDAGGGAKFMLYEQTQGEAGFAFGLRLDVRYKLTVGAEDETDGVPTLVIDAERGLDANDGHPFSTDYNGVFSHVELGGGAFILFGGGTGPDKDKDGIPNRTDACPEDPEDKDDFEDLDGCPDLDNDQDNVLDVDDGCINEPEDRDGWEDEDGCPDVDNDGDGIADTKDECPTRAEDEDGFEDRDGCPDLDNDQDGFLDVDDGCANAPENFNAYLDDDGCPDEIPPDLIEFAGAIPAIQFEVNSAKLKRSSHKILDKAARALMGYPDLSVEIAGHASSEGDDDYNMELSQERVLTVREYMIDRGIDPSRLTARGYGETQPVASNDTEEGRSINRRVEFRLTRIR